MQSILPAHAPLIALCAIALVILLIVWGVIHAAASARRRRRKAGLRDWAFRNGFDYTEGPVPARDLASIQFFATDTVVRDVTATNIVRGPRGTNVTLLDLHRTTRSYSGPYGIRAPSTDSTHTYALFNLADPVPSFSFTALTADGPDTERGQALAQLTRLAQSAPGRSDHIAVPDHPGFLLISHGGEAAPLFTSERVRFFEDKCGWTVLGEGSWLLLSADPMIYEHGWKRMPVVDVTNYDDFVDLATAIRQYFATQ